MSQQLENGAMDKVMSALKEPDRFLEETLDSARESADRFVAEATHYARTEPMKALATAAVAGLAVRILPVRRIVNTLAHIALALLKPAVVIYGGAKVWHKLHAETAPDSHGNPGPAEADSEKMQSAAGRGSRN